MSASALRKVVESVEKPDKEARIYVITGKAEQLDKLEKFLAWVTYCGNVGHSGVAQLSVDGEGAARIKVEKKDGEMTKPSEEDWQEDAAKAKNGLDLKIGID